MRFPHISPTLSSILISLCILAFGSCQSEYKDASNKRIADEKLASQMLTKARVEMKAKRYEDARRTVKLMRDTCRYALQGREEGIILLDSIELLQAVSDTTAEDHDMRVQFYMKKLDHDRKNRKHYQ